MKRVRTLTARVLQICGLIVVLVTLTPVTSWWGRALAGRSAEPRGGVLIILAGAEATDGFMGLDTYWRCVYAVRAWQAGGFERIYISGGTFHHTPLSSQMKKLLTLYGIPAERIVEEPRSHSTRENALFLAPMLAAEQRRKLLITSDLHMFRARRVLARAGIHTECRAAPDAIKRGGSWSERWSVFLDLLAESVRIGYYYIRGWM